MSRVTLVFYKDRVITRYKQIRALGHAQIQQVWAIMHHDKGSDSEAHSTCKLHRRMAKMRYFKEEQAIVLNIEVRENRRIALESQQVAALTRKSTKWRLKIREWPKESHQPVISSIDLWCLKLRDYNQTICGWELLKNKTLSLEETTTLIMLKAPHSHLWFRRSTS